MTCRLVINYDHSPPHLLGLWCCRMKPGEAFLGSPRIGHFQPEKLPPQSPESPFLHLVLWFYFVVSPFPLCPSAPHAQNSHEAGGMAFLHGSVSSPSQNWGSYRTLAAGGQSLEFFSHPVSRKFQAYCIYLPSSQSCLSEKKKKNLQLKILMVNSG